MAIVKRSELEHQLFDSRVAIGSSAEARLIHQHFRLGRNRAGSARTLLLAAG